ncbi:MAG: bifunctional hydroxymethylpyrimidine kinase/phosphomethylpyrimidine kinase [Proteobacteria bacterium]|nr:bifunctional hydroxymethylpyrimidine kinase/phosphomethylpyrimidine kinase [Pseudomonadota bacterium]
MNEKTSAGRIARVLTVAGSDPVGGAGLQADLKTITALGGHAMSAVTAVTVQDTVKLHDIMPMSADMVAAQIRVLIADIGLDAIKSGMLVNASIVGALADVLSEEAADVTYVLDPVLASTSGERLLDEAATEVMVTRLLPRAALVTPNIREAAMIARVEIANLDDVRKAAEAILAKGARAVLVTGGHLADRVDGVDNVTDLLVTADGPEGAVKFSTKRIVSRSTRGTGCTLSAAIATGLGQGKSLTESIETARDFVRRAIENAPDLGSGDGPMGFGNK